MAQIMTGSVSSLHSSLKKNNRGKIFAKRKINNKRMPGKMTKGVILIFQEDMPQSQVRIEENTMNTNESKNKFRERKPRKTGFTLSGKKGSISIKTNVKVARAKNRILFTTPAGANQWLIHP